MADIALVTANKVNVVESIIQATIPALEAIVAGAPIRIDPSSKKFTNANATTEAEARAWGIALKTVAAGEPVTGLHLGVIDGYDLSGLAGDANVFLSDTDGRLADAPGTVALGVGRVIPGTAVTLGTAYDNLLFVDFGAVGQGALGPASETITAPLLAASVDTQIFVADQPYQVTLVKEIHSVVGGSGAAVRPRKILAAATDAPGAAAGANVKELTTAAIDLTTTINTTQTPALVATAADLLLAVGDKIALDFSGTLTGLVGSITITLRPI